MHRCYTCLHTSERHDVVYDAFVQLVLSPEDWTAWEAGKVQYAPQRQQGAESYYRIP